MFWEGWRVGNSFIFLLGKGFVGRPVTLKIYGWEIGWSWFGSGDERVNIFSRHFWVLFAGATKATSPVKSQWWKKSMHEDFPVGCGVIGLSETVKKKSSSAISTKNYHCHSHWRSLIFFEIAIFAAFSDDHPIVRTDYMLLCHRCWVHDEHESGPPRAWGCLQHQATWPQNFSLPLKRHRPNSWAPHLTPYSKKRKQQTV